MKTREENKITEKKHNRDAHSGSSWVADENPKTRLREAEVKNWALANLGWFSAAPAREVAPNGLRGASGVSERDLGAHRDNANVTSD